MCLARTKLLLSGLLAVLLVAILAAATSVAAAGNPSATGGGTTEEAGKKSTFVFNAIEHKDGTVNGHLVYQFRGADVFIHMDIDCLNIFGNQAVLSGTVTKVTGTGANLFPFIFVGAPATFQVEDNGEGNNAPPDQISDLFFGVPDCHNFTTTTYLPISGNIQVKP